MAKFPEVPEIAYPLKLIRSYKTLIFEADSGLEQRRRRARFPKRRAILTYPPMPKADRDVIADWFSDYHGMYGDANGDLFYFFDQAFRHHKDEYVGRGTGAALTLDLHSKTTTPGATLIIYEDDVAQIADTDYTFVSGGGTEGADRITWIAGHFPATGALITSAFNGYLRIKARFAVDEMEEEIFTFSGTEAMYRISIPLQEVQW
jgi:hypothetical protein